MYEVDNRYPEAAEPYEKIRGVRRHGGVPLGSPFSVTAKRAIRINNLKRSFRTAAAAVIAVITLLLVPPGEDPPAVEPDAFRAPSVRIVTALQSESRDDALEYRYRMELNDAERGDVSVSACTEDRELLGQAGPFSHEQTESSELLTLPLSRTEDLSRVVLKVVCVYLREDRALETRDETLVPLRTGPPEPVTEPVTEPLTEPVTEPVTEPTDEPATEPTEPTEPEPPFTAPTLTIVSTALNDPDVTPLTYSYKVALNSAESLRVTAAVTSDTGASLGSGGPWNHTASETSPSRSTALRWTARPSSVKLTLTGVYTEKGEEKTLTASQTLNVPEEPFTAPTLTIVSAALNGTDVTPLTYSYKVTLNSAESLRVTAAITSDTGASLGSGGPWNHNASGTSPSRSTALRWTARPSSVKLTLTGTYTEKGKTKTVTATQTLTVPEEPFTAPTLTIVSATLNGTDVTPLTYSYTVTLNSAESLRVTAAVTDQAGASLGSGGPWNHNASGTSPSRSTALHWTARPSSVTLTLTGTYTEKGETKTLKAKQTLPVSDAPFTAPTLTIVSAALNDPDVTPLTYSYKVTLNSAESLRVTAAITDQAGASLGSGGPWTHTASETSPSRSTALHWTARPSSVTLTLTGTYTEEGTTKTLTASQTLTAPEEPFIAPTLAIVSAALNDPDVTPLTYSYKVALNSAESLRVTAAITDQAGASLGSGGPWTHTASESSPTRSTDLSWTNWPAFVTLTLTGTYTEKGTTKTLTATQTLTAPEEPFIAPTLAIVSAALNDPDVTPLTYSYTVTLNSAESLRVTAAITDQAGASLGSGGPWTHTASESSPTRSSALSWTDWPVSVTLTLTGTYTEKGETKTLTATQTLTAPEKPFEPPTLVIESAKTLPAELVLLYSYTVDLKDAADLTVSADFTYEDDDGYGVITTYSVGSDGPYVHDSSLTTELLEVPADEYPSEFPVTLTLTGTYTDKDVATQTLTATKVLDGFESPALWVLSAERDTTDPDLIRWSGEVWTNDADRLEVYVSIGTETEVLATEGPFSFTDHAELSDQTIRADGYAEQDLILTLTGSYELEGSTREISDYGYVDAIPFEEPVIHLLSVERGSGSPDTVLYQFGVDLNSADRLDVTAYFYDDAGTQIFQTAAPTECSDYGPFSGSCAPGTAAARIRLQGEYEHLGTACYVEVWGDVPACLVDPTITGLTAVVNDFEEWPEATFSYSYYLDVGTASNVRVSALLTTSGGLSASDELPETAFSVSADFADTVSPLYLEETDTFVTLTCTYEQNGTAGSFTQTISAPISMKANYFGFSCEYYSETPGELLLWLYADYEARNNDPHKTAYDFEIAAFTLDWYNAGLGTVDLTSAASAVLTVEYDDEYANYSLSCDLSTAIPENAASLRFSLTLRDKTTGKTYSDVSELMDLN